ncbi:MAG: glycosyltransferase [Bifidobacteriaceae bacterium]|jgi:hypothetical protein|nr:glycosyltransferase [Bifidobacteriaceae bacterium]
MNTEMTSTEIAATGTAPAYGMRAAEETGERYGVSGEVERIGAPAAVSVDVALPVYNRASDVDSRVRTLKNFLDDHATHRAGFTWNIVLVDMASTDGTWDVVSRLVAEFPTQLRALRMDTTGRGRALKAAWGDSQASVVSYMDLSLSADIKDIGFLIGSLLVGGADIAIGSRLLSESQVSRTLRREFISRTYNMLLHSYLSASFHDAQCGFKAITASAAKTLLPLVCDDGLFFDTELLLLAQNAGMLIYEIPVVWKQTLEDDINVSDTIQRDLEGMRRMKRTFAKGVTRDGVALPWARTESESDTSATSSPSTGTGAAAASENTPIASPLSAPILYDTTTTNSFVDSSASPSEDVTSAAVFSSVSSAEVTTSVADHDSHKAKRRRKAAAKAARRSGHSVSSSSASSARSFGGALGVANAVIQPVSSVGVLAQQTMLIDIADVRVR